MQHIQGICRNQLQMSSLEDKISTDNPVRFIDAFVSLLDLEKVGFEPEILNHNILAVAKIQASVKANLRVRALVP
jgi:hypothetical protein